MWFVGNIDTGFVVKTPRGLTLDGVQYPRNIFNLWSKAELAAIGIKPYREETIDTRYHNAGAVTRTEVNGEIVGTPASTDKDMADLKKAMVSEVKAQAASKLSSSDWMAIRAYEGGTAIASEWSTYRTNVRSTSNTKETEINALADLTAIKAYRAKPMTETRKVKHTADDGTETYGPETETFDRNVDQVTFGWDAAPDAPLDPAFVSIVDAS